ncbi:MAG TPA: ATP-binding protein [Candidatus Angelobacter sp.]|jgi:hypothetical protein|nr:ATP-binding protein [Candidatus Angelobacter sp.]
MVIRFSAENFRSFKEKQELTLVATSLKELPGALIHIDGFSHDLLRVAAIYGANASGKTNVLKALSFMCSTVRNSHSKWAPEARINRHTFRLNQSESKPSSFEVEFLVSGTPYRYGFVLNTERILEEWLLAYPQGKQQLWFTRNEKQKEGQEPAGRFSFGRHLSGENRAIEALTRKNSLFLSAAAQNNHSMLLPVYNWFAANAHFAMAPRDSSQSTANMCKDNKRKEILANMLSSVDLGVTGLRVEEVRLDEEVESINAEHFKNFFAALKNMVSALDPQANIETITKLFLLHRGSDEKPVEFPLEEESAGTSAYFALLGPVISVLENGGVLCVDELDSSLHPLLALELVKLFNDEKLNPMGAQLIFNTHDTNLLDNSILRRDQIWFTEKDAQGATHLYPLSDFTPRKNENLKRGYLQGRFGAVPFIGQIGLEMKRHKSS